MARPLIGITADVDGDRYQVATSYAAAVTAAGGLGVLLPCETARADEYARLCDGIVLTGGDDPIMEHWASVTHPAAKRIDPRRQAFELALLAALDAGGGGPVLGICLGMQLMGLHRGGALDQHLPETLSTSGRHWPRNTHSILGDLGEGVVHSHHHQALSDAGRLQVVATACDGVIEAVRDESRPFYLGVQWHPERTPDEKLGAGLFRDLVRAADGVKGAYRRPLYAVGSHAASRSIVAWRSLRSTDSVTV